MTFQIPSKFILLLVSMISVISMNAMVSYDNIDKVNEAQTPIRNIVDTQTQLEALHIDLFYANNMLRSYLLARSGDKLSTYQQHVARIEKALARLKPQLAGNLAQKNRLEQINLLIEKKFQVMDLAQLKSVKNLTPSQIQQAEVESNLLIQKILLLSTAIREEESRQLFEHQSHFEHASHVARLTFVFSLAVNFFLLAIVFLMMRRTVQAQREIRQVMQTRNTELTNSLAMTDRSNRKVSGLLEMSRYLQSCDTIDEASKVLSRFLPDLFDAKNGTIHLALTKNSLFELSAHWGNSNIPQTIMPEDCWAIRRGHTYVTTTEPSALRCSHNHADHTPSICLPLSIQGKIIGLLHLSSFHDENTYSELGINFAEAVAEQISLSISNLQLRDNLRQQSIRDPLTGAFNRRYLEEFLSKELARAQRRAMPIGVMMLDVDHFKRFNDEFGHDAGDVVLREVAQTLARAVRTSDIVCRYGGEEFAVVMPDLNEPRIRERAEALRMAIENLQLHHGSQSLPSVTISIGYAIFPEHAEDITNLFLSADTALYRAKASGRNRVEGGVRRTIDHDIF